MAGTAGAARPAEGAPAADPVDRDRVPDRAIHLAAQCLRGMCATPDLLGEALGPPRRRGALALAATPSGAAK